MRSIDFYIPMGSTKMDPYLEMYWSGVLDALRNGKSHAGVFVKWLDFQHELKNFAIPNIMSVDIANITDNIFQNKLVDAILLLRNMKNEFEGLKRNTKSS